MPDSVLQGRAGDHETVGGDPEKTLDNYCTRFSQAQPTCNLHGTMNNCRGGKSPGPMNGENDIRICGSLESRHRLRIVHRCPGLSRPSRGERNACRTRGEESCGL